MTRSKRPPVKNSKPGLKKLKYQARELTYQLSRAARHHRTGFWLCVAVMAASVAAVISSLTRM